MDRDCAIILDLLNDDRPLFDAVVDPEAFVLQLPVSVTDWLPGVWFLGESCNLLQDGSAVGVVSLSSSLAASSMMRMK